MNAPMTITLPYMQPSPVCIAVDMSKSRMNRQKRLSDVALLLHRCKSAGTRQLVYTRRIPAFFTITYLWRRFCSPFVFSMDWPSLGIMDSTMDGKYRAAYLASSCRTCYSHRQLIGNRRTRHYNHASDNQFSAQVDELCCVLQQSHRSIKFLASSHSTRTRDG